MQGIDFIYEALTEYQSHLPTESVKTDDYQRFLGEFNVHMKDIKTTNEFMLMEIHRCIDFTKASQGLKLVPKIETLNFFDSIALPINCMKNIQHKIRITLKPVPAKVCNYVMTDKQWLQENLLCLLSNAVKYSYDGEVVVTISLKKKLTEHNDSDHFNNKPGASPRPPLGHARTSSSHSAAPPAIEHPESILNLYKKSSDPDDNAEEYLLFEVEDQGIGMAEEAMKTLFSAFHQTQKLAGGHRTGLIFSG